MANGQSQRLVADLHKRTLGSAPTDAATVGHINEWDRDYEAAIEESDWSKAAELLDSFSRKEIHDRLARCSSDQIAKLHEAAISHPTINPFSDVAELSLGTKSSARQMISAEVIARMRRSQQ